MSTQTTQALRRTVLAISREAHEDAQDIIVEFLASCLASESSDPAHVYGPALVKGIEEGLTNALLSPA